jgi:hypothetical protein
MENDLVKGQTSVLGLRPRLVLIGPLALRTNLGIFPSAEGASNTSMGRSPM